MTSTQKGFGLIEIMISMVLGLIVLLGITQIFVSSKQTYQAQAVASTMQEDARYVLTRISQELRMAGMYGCLDATSITNWQADFDTPIDWNAGGSELTIVTSSPASGAAATTDAHWTLLTDCRSTASVEQGNATPATGQIALPIRKVTYRLNNGQLQVKENAGNFQTLIDGVGALDIQFAQAASASDAYVSGDYIQPSAADMARVRSVRVALQMVDGTGKVASQTYTVVAALRNRLL